MVHSIAGESGDMVACGCHCLTNLQRPFRVCSQRDPLDGVDFWKLLVLSTHGYVRFGSSPEYYSATIRFRTDPNACIDRRPFMARDCVCDDGIPRTDTSMDSGDWEYPAIKRVQFHLISETECAVRNGNPNAISN